jgi:uncharacterized protein YjdB
MPYPRVLALFALAAVSACSEPEVLSLDPAHFDVTLHPDEFALELGATVTILVTVSGGDSDAPTTVSCTASNGHIAAASVDGSCRVTALSEGSATLTVSVQRGSHLGGAEAQVDVIVDVEAVDAWIETLQSTTRRTPP